MELDVAQPIGECFRQFPEGANARAAKQMPNQEASGAVLQPSGEQDPAREEISVALNRVLTDSRFRASARRRSFLRYLVEQTLAGEGARLKAYTIATTVFGRGKDFDPQTDPIVRLEAMRLRRDLEQYYLTAGQSEELRFAIPKGSYVPTFARHAADVAVPQPMAEEGEFLDLAPAPSGAAVAWPRLHRRLAAALSIVVLIAALAGAWSGAGFRLGPVAPENAAAARPRVIVTQFTGQDIAPGRGHLARGITEDLLSNLSRFLGLRVVWSDGSGPIPGGPMSKGDYVLQGSVRQHGDQIRVAVQLLERATTTVVWADHYDHVLVPTDLYAFIDNTARRVAATIGSQHGIIAQLGVAAAQRKAPESLSSYECVLRAYELQRTMIAEQHSAIRGCLEQAVTVDPTYSDAWALLSWAYGQEQRFEINLRPHLYDAGKRSLEAAQRAVEVASENPVSHLALAIAHFDNHEVEKFRAAAQMALQLNPNNPLLLSHVGLRTALSGDWDRGIPMLREALALNLNHPTFAYLAFSLYHYNRGEYDDAVREVLRSSVLGNFWPPAIEAMSFAMLGRELEARESAARLLAFKPDFPSRFRQLVGYWNLPPALIEAMAEGLRRAGVTVQ
ncbi:MAG: hypothetical protein AB7K86_10405 [Rhodospirillales bacterium]